MSTKKNPVEAAAISSLFLQLTRADKGAKLESAM